MGVLVSRPEDIAVFGRNSAALIGQLEFWLHKAAGGKSHRVVERNGYLWVAMPRLELFSQVMLTEKQGKTVLERLRAVGVLVTKRHIVNGKVLLHYRLDEGTLCAARMEAVPDDSARRRALEGYKSSAKSRGVPFSLSREQFEDLAEKVCHYCGSPPSNTATRRKRGKQVGEVFVYNGLDRVDPDGPYSVDNCVPCCWTCNNAKAGLALAEFEEWARRLVGHFGKRAKSKGTERANSHCALSGTSYITCETIEENIAAEPQVEGKKMSRGPKSKIGLTVSAVAAGQKQDAMSPVSIRDASKPGQLGLVWKRAWNNAFEEFGGNLTGKQEKQLRTIFDKCPGGEGAFVIDHAVRNWSLFVATASQREGAFNAPEMPSVSFLLRFVQSAVQCWQEREGGEALLPTPAKPVKTWKVPQASKKVSEQPLAKPGLDEAQDLLGW